LTGKLNLIWLAFPIAEIMSFVATLFYFRRINKKIISKMPAEE
jgi:Na+-driven multidrug efflux pump